MDKAKSAKQFVVIEKKSTACQERWDIPENCALTTIYACRQWEKFI